MRPPVPSSPPPQSLSPAQWRALTSSHRMHLWVALQGLGRASVAELAAITGRPAPSLYHHLGILARAGIVRTATERRDGRAVRIFVFDPEVNRRVIDPRTGAGVRQLGKAAAVMLRDAGVRARRWGAVADGRPIELGLRSEAILVTEVAWFRAADRARVNRHVRAILRISKQSRRKRAGERTCLVLCHFPDVTAAEARARLRG